MEIILASKSPRRQELLRNIGIKDFNIVPSASDETIPEGFQPSEVVRLLSMCKAESVSKAVSDEDLIIAADTLVYLDNKPLGKPKNEDDAVSMLKRLSGKRHSVLTGIAVIRGDIKISAHEETFVYFRDLSETEIVSYVKTGEPLDKAGAYGIQGLGSVLISKIDGDYFNVVGLPLQKLYSVLKTPGLLPEDHKMLTPLDV